MKKAKLCITLYDGHMRTRGKCRKHEPQESVFYISRVFSDDRSVLSQCNTRLRLLQWLNDFTRKKTIKHAFSVLYSDKTWPFDRSERTQGPIYIIKGNKIMVFSYPQENFTKTSKVCIMRDPKRIMFIHRLSLFITLGG